MNTRKLHRFVTATLTAALLGASMLNGAAARQTLAASSPEAGANTKLAAPGQPSGPETLGPAIAVTKKITAVVGGPAITVGPNLSVDFQIDVAVQDAPSAFAMAITDTLPPFLVLETAWAPIGQIEILSETNIVRWLTPVPQGNSLASVIVRARLANSAPCGQAIVNTAQWSSGPSGGSQSGLAQAPAYIVPCPDLGDAPDSSNHFGAPMQAYIGVPAAFPTVFDSPLGQPRGPKHLNAGPIHLGPRFSIEGEADQGPDADGPNNLRPISNTANLDLWDDGLLARPTLVNCQVAQLRVSINVTNPIVGANAYLNAWLDINRDGDWADFFQCPNDVASPEHILIDQLIPTGAPGMLVITVPTSSPVFWPTAMITKPAWLRLTLSDQMSPKPLGGLYGDGRGPDLGYAFGETEDYIVNRANTTPTASAGSDRVVFETDSVTLDGSGSMAGDPANLLDFHWEQISGPMVVLTAPDAPSTNFLAPTIGAPETVLRFRLTVTEYAPLQGKSADTVMKPSSGGGDPTGMAETEITITVTQEIGDFGDAPDSTFNAYGGWYTNTAYPMGGGIPGRFPSAYISTPPGQDAGPRHSRANIIYLGNNVTREADADLLPDADIVTNILNGGADVANMDEGDDGWLNPNVPFADCRTTTLRVRVRRTALPLPANLQAMYLNVWRDGNRDGDWEDWKNCPQTVGTTVVPKAFEWIVQNWAVGLPPAGGFVDLNVPTMLVRDDMPNAPVWLRFSLSERPIPMTTTTGLADGRGPNAPFFHATGETEDYYRPGEPEGQPGPVYITKTAPAGPLHLGDVFTYSVLVQHVGGTAPATAYLTDALPSGVTWAGLINWEEVNPSVAALGATFNPAHGPNGTAYWWGMLSPNAIARVDVRVRVTGCPLAPITNIAHLRSGGALRESAASTIIECVRPNPHITLTKRILTDTTGITPGATSTDPTGLAALMPLGEVFFALDLSADGIEPVAQTAARITDAMPEGVVALSVQTNHGVARVLDGGRAIAAETVITAARMLPWQVWVRARIIDVYPCSRVFTNTAQYRLAMGGVVFEGNSNTVVGSAICPDLGDAPDSSNHWGMPMTAYPGVPALFPTVFDSPFGQPRGPKHWNARVFHLGKAVSFEREADLAADTDGVNNLRPPLNQPNLDRFDDGLLRRPAFVNCQTTQLVLLIHKVLPAPANVGFLNVWIDGNHDGDWGDAVQCPNIAGGTTFAPEHILIDAPVALGAPGFQVVTVTTTGPVPWDPANTLRPAWLRVTLSEQPSVKVLPVACVGAGCVHGDGRGPNTGFRFGETEDYLYRQAEQHDNADPIVIKRGEILPRVSPDGTSAPDLAWHATWLIEYGNAGSDTATDVVVKDTLAGDQTLEGIRMDPPVPATTTGPESTFLVGTLLAGQRGRIQIHSTLPITTPPGTVITNTVTITGSNDADPGNNTAVVTLTVPLLPPVIVSPQAGSTCTGVFTVAGMASPGATVHVFVDGIEVGTAIAGPAGRWALGVSLPDGSHAIHAVAEFGGMMSPPSPTVVIIVDSTLTWDPLSLRFIDADGNVLSPRDGSGRMDETGWMIRLRAHMTYTVRVRVCCEDANATVTLDVPGVGEVVLTDPDGDHVYEATFVTGDRVTLESGAVRLCVTCHLIRRCTDGTILIDPYGVVYDAALGIGSPLKDAQVMCLEDKGGAAFGLWNAADTGQINPQMTQADGWFSFFTPPGTFRLVSTKTGYQTFRSGDIVVSSAPVRYDIPMTAVPVKTAQYTVTVSESGFEPTELRVPPGSVVAFVNLDTGAHASTSYDGAVVGLRATAADAWDSGALESGEEYVRAFDVLGEFNYYDTQNPGSVALIVVEPAAVFRGYLPAIVR
ncbi:MAG TPA: GEVED domain-containing protein [Thermoflexales bacterium]|nr:GEVED domain-containing protein [Thermoflexales bacterium]